MKGTRDGVEWYPVPMDIWALATRRTDKLIGYCMSNPLPDQDRIVTLAISCYIRGSMDAYQAEKNLQDRTNEPEYII